MSLDRQDAVEQTAEAPSRQRAVSSRVGPVGQRLARNVRIYRFMHDVQQSDLAESMRVVGHPWGQVTVSEVETHKRAVSVDELASLARLFDVSIEVLLSEWRLP